MPKIYCNIHNCHYWSEGNQCDASEIMVTADAFASQAPDHMDASDHIEFPQMQANQCMETCCKTFVPANSDQIRVDGVTRNS
ncbi:MAG TPA: DUF1540 domain-containing protein [Bacillota bacterium]|nr:DUF1540 domain-containing protein [Bacillota bacterium]HPT86811.1 DUF1540 domain-containing protein [Bacillota bacterium]